MSADPPPSSDFPLSDADRRKILSGLLLIIFLGALGQLIVAPVLPTLGAELGDVEHLPWIVTAYLLSAAVSTPIFGKLSDIHGRRRILMAALIIFMAGSVLCAVAPSMVLLAVARGIQGLGGGAFIALCQAAIADVIPARERGLYQGHIVSAFAASTIGGPIVGGLLAEYAHWSLIFWLNLPIGLVAMVMMDRAMRDLPVHTVERRLDTIGASLVIFAIIALLLALSWGGVHYPWLSPQILGLGALSFAGLGAYVFYARRAADPFLPLSVLQDRVVAPACLSSFFTMVALIGLSAYMPMYFELVLGFSTSHASLAQTALACGTTAGGLTMGRVVAHMKQPKHLAMPLQAVAIACLVLLTLAIERLPLPGVLVIMLIIGFAFGTMFPLTTVSTQNAVDRSHLGVVMATLNLLRNIGGAMGSAVYGAILLGSAGGAHVSSLAAISPTALAQGYTILFGGVALAVLLSLVTLAPMERRPIK